MGSTSDAATERFGRCALLAAGCSRRLWVLARVGCPAALFCIGQSAWPRTAVAHAQQGLKVVLRSTLHGVAEAFGFFADMRWRDDVGAWSVVAPWELLRRAGAVGWGARGDYARSLVALAVGLAPMWRPWRLWTPPRSCRRTSMAL